jgi:hypothetical protein
MLPFLYVGCMLVSGCAQSVARGTVVMKASEEVAHVSLGREDVGNGDRVGVFRHRCEALVAKKLRTCERKALGSGTVTEVLNEKYSEVTFRPGVAFREGDEVELRR